MIQVTKPLIGAPISRLDGPRKVTGTATYAFEYQFEDVVYAFPVQSTIAKGRVVAIDATHARTLPGFLGLITHENAPKVAPVGLLGPNNDLAVLQSDRVAYRGQFIAVVVAETLENARRAAELLDIRYEALPPDAELRADRADLVKPQALAAGMATDTEYGDVEAALSSSPVQLDQTYTTPAYHHNALEPHATIAIWKDDSLTLYDSNQGPHAVQHIAATAFNLPPERVRVISAFVGGGFGSKGGNSHFILTIMAAQLIKGRPVKMALTRQQMFAVVGYRTPTIQHLRLGAEQDGQLMAISHEVVEQTGMLHEFAEPTASATRMMYAAPHRRTAHRLARLDVPIPTFMRAPGECPGMFALESAIDELALACGIDPIEFRIKNDPAVDPESGLPFSSRNLVACLRQGAEAFGWQQHPRQPATWREGRWLIGTGVAASTFPVVFFPSTASIRAERADHYRVLIDASDIGTGAWTVLAQIAADALEVPLEQIHLEIGDTNLPMAGLAGGSAGTASWGSAIMDAAQKFRATLYGELGGRLPEGGLEVRGGLERSPYAGQYAMHSFGAQFAEVRVHMDTGEIRVPRMLGVFAAGRIINAKTARSQFLGGMTMGLSMALHEQSVMDPRFGEYVNHDFAEYHIATNADVGAIEIQWIDEVDPYVNPVGAKGIGEIGIVGTAAAIANAVYHATGIRVRDLPLSPDKLLASLSH
ncbi:xanthine dehydrogenase [Reticulibacter mediterranei]|uniref:Xanthine dehydrogenase n=1 Tax=Reticulibacter mediterranei TaxID=2778369 RepID=A0A8J3MZH8_9CHLR|nr:xanthine dehydrogenase family protein molybdopterin-binding subunit [Reticulibacter mediterranei]GHO90473.1 xanthine dehydrogenase [Reticulibacter mediterranei]